MRQLTPNEKTYGLTALLVAAIVCAFVFYIEPTRKNLTENFNKANLLKIEYELAQDRAGSVSGFQTEYQSIVDTDTEITHHFFAVGDELAFFQEIEQVAAATGVTLTIQFTPTKDGPELKSIPVTFTATGTALQLISFVDRLEHLQQYLTTTGVRIETEETTTAIIEMLSHWYTKKTL